MSENITIARPYAKAIFDIAKKTNTLMEWDDLLNFLSISVNSKSVISFVKNKTIPHDRKSQFILELIDFQEIFDKNCQKFCTNFINFLSFYERLLCMKEIYALYKKHINIELGRIEVLITVASSINNNQKEEIINNLSKKFNKKVSALFEIDEGLLGGFFVKIGDFVLDASLTGNLNSLRTKIII